MPELTVRKSKVLLSVKKSSSVVNEQRCTRGFQSYGYFFEFKGSVALENYYLVTFRLCCSVLMVKNDLDSSFSYYLLTY